MNKSLKEMLDAVRQEQVPYEGLAALTELSGGAHPPSDENPKHLEDFMSLLDVAARKQKQDE